MLCAFLMNPQVVYLMSASNHPVSARAKQHSHVGITMWQSASVWSSCMEVAMAIPTTSRPKQLAKVFACNKTGVSILDLITGSQSSTLFDWCRDTELKTMPPFATAHPNSAHLAIVQKTRCSSKQRYFCVINDYAGKVDLSKVYWNRKNSLWKCVATPNFYLDPSTLAEMYFSRMYTFTVLKCPSLWACLYGWITTSSTLGPTRYFKKSRQRITWPATLWDKMSQQCMPLSHVKNETCQQIPYTDALSQFFEERE